MKHDLQTENVFKESQERLTQTDPEFVKIAVNFSQSEVPRESKLTEKERMLCILSALLGCQGMGEFRNILHTALENGVEPVAVKEMTSRQNLIFEKVRIKS